MLVESITGAVVEGFVSSITERFINGRKTSVEISEIRTEMFEIKAFQGRSEERLAAIEQLVATLARHDPFATTGDARLVVRPTLSGTTVENALDQFSSSVLAQIRSERGERTDSIKVDDPQDPLRNALSGFHDEVTKERQKGTEPQKGSDREKGAKREKGNQPR